MNRWRITWIALAIAALAMGVHLSGSRSVPPSIPTRTADLEPAPTVARSPDATAVGPPPVPQRAEQLALEIERSLVALDPQQRETAFTYLLPELIRVDAGRAIQMVARQEAGEARDALRDELTRQWIRQDREAAVAWLQSLENDAERRDSATVAVRTLAAGSPAEAIAVADQFGIGRDDGSLEHIVQIWATADPEAATRWIDSQPPDDPRTKQLRARIDQVRAQKGVPQ